MRKSIAAAISVVLVILFLGIGLLAYSYTQINVSVDGASFHSIEWESFSWSTMLNLGLNVLTGNWLGAAFDLIQGINLNLLFGLSNNGFLPVYIPDLTYDLAINDVHVGRGYTTIDATIYPGETRKIPALQNFQKSSLTPAVSSIVSTGGVINLHVSGTAYFKLLGLSIPIPFESTKQISIVDEIKNRLNSEIQKNKQQRTSASSSVGQAIQNAAESIVNQLRNNQQDLNLPLQGDILYDSIYEVGPGSYTYVSFSLPCVGTIQGGFIASAGLGDNIIVYVLDEHDFNLYQNGEEAGTYYNSGKTEYDTFDLTLNPGEYYIVMSNTYSTFSTKNVQLQVSGFCH